MNNCISDTTLSELAKIFPRKVAMAHINRDEMEKEAAAKARTAHKCCFKNISQGRLQQSGHVGSLPRRSERLLQLN